MTRTRPGRLLALATTAVAVAAATVAAVALMPAGTAHAESNGGVKVMPLGDSITDGIQTPGGYRIGLWQKLVAGGYTVDFVGSLYNGPASLGDHDHEGHSGWRIDQLDANIVNWLRKYNPHTVLLHIGTNDISQNYNVSSAPARLGSLIDKITSTSPDTEVFVAQLIPLAYNQNGVRSFNAQVPGLVQTRAAAGKHVHLVDMFSALTTSDLTDQVHPTANGYNKMAAVWYTALQSVPGSLRPGVSPSSAGPSSASVSPSRPGNSASPSRPGGSATPAACTATYSVAGQWQGGFQATVTVTAGGAAVSGWTATWTLGGGQSLGSSWGATLTTSGSGVTARSLDYNGSLAAGASTTFGFLATSTGTPAVPVVTCTAG